MDSGAHIEIVAMLQLLRAPVEIQIGAEHLELAMARGPVFGFPPRIYRRSPEPT